jgi:hypothetical protein
MKPRLDAMGARLVKDALFIDGDWQLHPAGTGTWSERQGWHTIIAHMCPDVKGTPFWMLIERHEAPTICMFCKADMPDTIIALFKLHNMDMIHGG